MFLSFHVRRSQTDGEVLRVVRKLRQGVGTRTADERKSFVAARSLRVQSSGPGAVDRDLSTGRRVRMQAHRRRVGKIC